jgi:hypothetical protein
VPELVDTRIGGILMKRRFVVVLAVVLLGAIVLLGSNPTSVPASLPCTPPQGWVDNGRRTSDGQIMWEEPSGKGWFHCAVPHALNPPPVQTPPDNGPHAGQPTQQPVHH